MDSLRVWWGRDVADYGASLTLDVLHKMITDEIIESMERSVLCWLSTLSEDGYPNVSPKEAFTHDGAGKILVANIASPGTVRNIEWNKNVCVSFINVFIQKGYKIKGRARVLTPDHPGYADRKRHLTAKIGSEFPIISVIEIEPAQIEEIIAPSYRLFPDTGPLDRVKESVRTYKVIEYLKQAEPDAAAIAHFDLWVKE